MTNSQFECADKPSIPSNYAEMDAEGKARTTALLIVGMEYTIDDCKSQLVENKTVLQIQGATITDTLIEAPVKSKLFGVIPR